MEGRAAVQHLVVVVDDEIAGLEAEAHLVARGAHEARKAIVRSVVILELGERQRVGRQREIRKALLDRSVGALGSDGRDQVALELGLAA